MTGPRKLRLLMLELLKLRPGFEGICRQCGCTEDNACLFEGFFGLEACGWLNKEHTVCTNPNCILKDDLQRVREAARGAARRAAVTP
jgi:hypothetical protein